MIADNKRMDAIMMRLIAFANATLWLLLPTTALSNDVFDSQIRPLLVRHCVTCHSTEKLEGELDLERFKTGEDAGGSPAVWESVLEQVTIGEMPPKDSPPLSTDDEATLLAWVRSTLDRIASENAGDPGAVVLRRLSNAEYTYSIRDLTGVHSLDPAREFPVDGAAGEGFTNAGAALVMSPTLLTKYLDAAKAIADHAVLLPDTIAFSPSTSSRDWANERLASIRDFYSRYSHAEGATAVDLQGIRFDTNSGGRLSIESYLAALAASQESLADNTKGVSEVAAETRLNAKYLDSLWRMLQQPQNSLILRSLKQKWDSGELSAQDITAWQQNLWRFTSVGHIGKLNGPKSWQEPVSPLVASHPMRIKLNAPADGGDVIVYLSTGDAGDGNTNDFAVWANPRLVAPQCEDVPLVDIRSRWGRLKAHRESIVANTPQCLAAADEADRTDAESFDVVGLADRYAVDVNELTAWLNYLGINRNGGVKIEPLISQPMESTPDYNFVKGWTGENALSVLANPSDADVRIPGLLRAHSVAVHPSPTSAAVVAWQSQISGTVKIDGVLFDAHTDCGNGFAWSLEVRRGRNQERLAGGTSEGASPITIGPFENVRVSAGDAVVVVIGPRDANHVCDLTAIDLTIRNETTQWDLAKEISPDILAGNPHADSHGNRNVWHFASQPATGETPSTIPKDSLLDSWRKTGDTKTRETLAVQVQRLLENDNPMLTPGSPDAALRSALRAIRGPLMTNAADANPTSQNPLYQNVSDSTVGVDPELFGVHPESGDVAAADLCVRAPALIEVRLPAEMVDGMELIVEGKLHPSNGGEGSVQMQLLTQRPDSLTEVAIGKAEATTIDGRWTDNNLRTIHSTPVIADAGGPADKRFEKAFDDFRELFPVALCYTTIVPVDEVVTLTLYYREDNHLKRLMLNDNETAEIDRL